jgi:hypothetical protein
MSGPDEMGERYGLSDHDMTLAVARIARGELLLGDNSEKAYGGEFEAQAGKICEDRKRQR